MVYLQKEKNIIPIQIGIKSEQEIKKNITQKKTNFNFKSRNFGKIK